MTNSHYLTEKEISHFIESLKKEHKEIEAWLKVKHSEVLSIASDNSGSDIIDLASNHEEYLSTKREIERRTARKLEIEERLRDTQDFGYCDDCGIEIGAKRLNINHAFKLCIDCSEFNQEKARNYIK